MIFGNRSASPLRAGLVLMAAALIPAVAGCEAGANAPTQQWHQPTPGATATVNNVIRLINVFVLGPAPDSILAPGSSASVFLAISNAGPSDRLVQISAPGFATSVQLPAGGIGLASQQTVLLTGPSPQVILEGLGRPLQGGQFVRMTFTFERAGATTLDVPVMPWAADYSTFSPAPSPTPTATATPTTKKSRRHASPSPSPATPTPSPTG